jgi:hypothetical protein
LPIEFDGVLIPQTQMDADCLLHQNAHRRDGCGGDKMQAAQVLGQGLQVHMSRDTFCISQSADNGTMASSQYCEMKSGADTR